MLNPIRNPIIILVYKESEICKATKKLSRWMMFEDVEEEDVIKIVTNNARESWRLVDIKEKKVILNTLCKLLH